MSYGQKHERNRAIVEAFRAGETMAVLANRHGITISRVSRIINRAGASLGYDELQKRLNVTRAKIATDPAIREKIRQTITAKWAEGHWAGRRKILADDPERREDYISLRQAYGAAYAREVMGLDA